VVCFRKSRRLRDIDASSALMRDILSVFAANVYTEPLVYA
jgi:hypothetical protein